MPPDANGSFRVSESGTESGSAEIVRVLWNALLDMGAVEAVPPADLGAVQVSREGEELKVVAGAHVQAGKITADEAKRWVRLRAWELAAILSEVCGEQEMGPHGGLTIPDPMGPHGGSNVPDPAG